MNLQPGSLPNLIDRLRRYSPAPLLEAMQAGPDIQVAAQHLDALLRAVTSYLPRYLACEELRDPRPGRVSGRFREATIMFADISGFTAMSERLSLKGEEGAETITNIVGSYFTRMLDIAAQHGGDLLKFGGDALLVAFFGDDNSDTVDHAVHACLAAVEMQQAIVRFSEVQALGETFRLKMTVGLGSGLLFTANLGTPDKMEYTVMGEALANMALAEDQAEGGEIFIDENTFQLTKSCIEIGEVRNGCYKLVAIHERQAASLIASVSADARWPAAGLDLSLAADQLDALTPFLPPGLLDLLRFDPVRVAGRRMGEFRPVTVMFANFYGTEELITHLGTRQAALITEILNQHFTRMHEIIHRYEGVIDKVDSYVVGHRIMAMFGAPRAHVDDPERAVRVAWEMQAAMAAFADLRQVGDGLTLKQRIGINTGRVFAGNVGSDTRHEYSVMGDQVNLTSRLMSAAQEGQILISASTAAQIGKQFLLDEKKPVRVKGKSQPVPNYDVQGILERAPGRHIARPTPMIGRDDEWRAIWQVAEQSLQGQPRLLDVHGEMGMGKSRILEELMDRWVERGGVVLFGASLSYNRHTPFAPWTPILRDMLGLHADESDGVRIIERLRSIQPTWADWAALVAQVTQTPLPESDLLRSLDPKLRQQNLQRMIAGLVQAEAALHPLLIILDDLQWIDELSLSLFSHIVTHAQDIPLLFCVAYRPDEVVQLAAPPHTIVVLVPLSDDGSLALLNSELPTQAPIPQPLKNVILKNAQGNPLFIVEMAHALIENYLSFDPAGGVYRARADLERIQAPDTISRVILSRLDRLDEPSRNLLKVASAIGRLFQQWLLESVYPYRASEAEMTQSLLDMCNKAILDRDPSGVQVAFLFRHVMTREVAYETLLYAERRDLHRRIAQAIEKQDIHIDDYVESLAEHYSLAEEWTAALPYHLQAGQRAQSIYANQDAIHRYRQALQVAAHVPGSQEQQWLAHDRLCQIFITIGEYDQAIQHNDAALSLVLPISDTPEQLACRLADRCRKAASIYEKKSDYAAAFNWLRGGLMALEGRDSPQAALEAAQIRLVGASIYHRQGDNGQALQWCEQSLDIANRLSGDDPARLRVLAHVWYLQGAIYLRYGQAERVLDVCARSLDIYRQIGDIAGESQALINMAVAHFNRAEWPQARQNYDRALQIKERMGDVYGRALVANNLAEIYLNQGELDRAEELYRASLRTWTELGSIYGMGFLSNGLAVVAIRRQDWAQAAALLERSLTLFAQIKTEDLLSEIYRHQVEVCLGQGDLDRAMEWGRRSLDCAIAQEMKLEEGIARRVLGQVYAARGKHGQAADLLDSALGILEQLNNPYEMGQVLLHRGMLCSSQNLQAQAEQDLAQAMGIFAELGALPELERAQAMAAACRHE